MENNTNLILSHVWSTRLRHVRLMCHGVHSVISLEDAALAKKWPHKSFTTESKAHRRQHGLNLSTLTPRNACPRVVNVATTSSRVAKIGSTSNSSGWSYDVRFNAEEYRNKRPHKQKTAYHPDTLLLQKIEKTSTRQTTVPGICNHFQKRIKFFATHKLVYIFHHCLSHEHVRCQRQSLLRRVISSVSVTRACSVTTTTTTTTELVTIKQHRPCTSQLQLSGPTPRTKRPPVTSSSPRESIRVFKTNIKTNPQSQEVKQLSTQMSHMKWPETFRCSRVHRRS